MRIFQFFFELPLRQFPKLLCPSNQKKVKVYHFFSLRARVNVVLGNDGNTMLKTPVLICSLTLRNIGSC